MIVREIGSFVIGMLIVVGILGIAARYLTGKNDSAVEEITEKIIENELERLFELDDDSLDGKIDFSPGVNT